MIKNPRGNDGRDNTIPVDIAKKMTLAYRESQKADKGTFTEAAWFPAVQIKQLAEKVAKFEGDGVRIYFGRYTQEIIDAINKLEYGDKISDRYVDMDTLLLVVTKIIDGKPRTDYFIEKSTHKTALYKSSNGPVPTDPDNRANLCPTDCDDDSELMNP